MYEAVLDPGLGGLRGWMDRYGGPRRADEDIPNAGRNQEGDEPTQPIQIQRPNKRKVIHISTPGTSTTPTTSPPRKQARFAEFRSVGEVEAGPPRARPSTNTNVASITSTTTPPKHQARFSELQSVVEVEAGPSHAGPSTIPASNEPPPAQIFTARIIDIFPDICPDWVMREVITAPGPADVGIANIIAKALEEGYPKKADTLAKTKQKEGPEPGHQEGYKGKIFHVAKRREYGYHSKCIEGLSQAFPCIPVTQ